MLDTVSNGVLMEMGKLCDNRLVSGVDKMFKTSDSPFSTSPSDLIRLERLSTSTFFAHRLAYSSHSSMMISKC